MFSNLKEVYKAGRSRGYEFGQAACFEIEIGDAFQCATMFVIYDITETEEELAEHRYNAAYECECNARQMSPFEFTAKALNEYGDTDWSAASAWERFEEGIEAGIKCALRCHK